MEASLDGRAESRRTARIAALIALAIFVYASFLTTRSTLFDRDEPRFAQASVEMVQTGNYLYPTFDGELRADKPILIYWLVSAVVRACGISEWAVRFWAPVSLSLSALVTFFVGRRLFGARAGWLAMGFLAIAPLSLMEGTIATTDALLLLCITVAFASFVFAVLDGVKPWHTLALSAALAAALLTKGPVGLAVPVLSAIVALWMLRGRGVGARHAWMLAIASVVGTALFVAWGWPANEATHGEFYRRGIGHHVVERMSTPLEGHGGNFFLALPYYVPVVLLLSLPATLYLPAALSALFGGRLGAERARSLLIAWIVPCFVLMSCVSTKLVHYVFPIWPGLALVCAALVDASERDTLDDRDRRWLARGVWFAGVPIALLCGGLVAAPALIHLPALLVPAIVMAITLGAGAWFGIVLHRRGSVRRGAHVLIGGFAAAWLVGILLAMPVIERTKVAPAIAAAIRARTSNEIEVARFKFAEPSLDFYLDRPPITDLGDEAALAQWMQGVTPAVLVIPRERIEALRARLDFTRFEEVASARGFNISKGEPLELVALGRSLPARSLR
jgi:4-amino-4-deoxy-L-arabinose transferase-like glycosyltransferase